MPLDSLIVEALPPRGSVPWFDALMIAASTAGLVLPAVAIPVWLRARAPRLAWHSVLAMFGGLGLTLILQLACGRPRPEVLDPLLPIPVLPSFPSGHMVLVTALIVVLAAYRLRTVTLGVPLVFVVALSRVAVGHHHPSDAIAGVLLGLGLGIAAVVRARSHQSDPWRLRWILWPQLGIVFAATVGAYAGVFSGGNLRWLQVPNMDKIMHFLLFGVLVLGMHLQTRGRSVSVLGYQVPLAIALPLAGATAEELFQGLSPHRTADPFDLLADVLGMLLFWTLGRKLTSMPRRPENPKGTAVPNATRHSTSRPLAPPG